MGMEGFSSLAKRSRVQRGTGSGGSNLKYQMMEGAEQKKEYEELLSAEITKHVSNMPSDVKSIGGESAWRSDISNQLRGTGTANWENTSAFLKSKGYNVSVDATGGISYGKPVTKKRHKAKSYSVTTKEQYNIFGFGIPGTEHDVTRTYTDIHTSGGVTTYKTVEQFVIPILNVGVPFTEHEVTKTEYTPKALQQKQAESVSKLAIMEKKDPLGYFGERLAAGLTPEDPLFTTSASSFIWGTINKEDTAKKQREIVAKSQDYYSMMRSQYGKEWGNVIAGTSGPVTDIALFLTTAGAVNAINVLAKARYAVSAPKVVSRVATGTKVFWGSMVGLGLYDIGTSRKEVSTGKYEFDPEQATQKGLYWGALLGVSYAGGRVIGGKVSTTRYAQKLAEKGRSDYAGLEVIRQAPKIKRMNARKARIALEGQSAWFESPNASDKYTRKYLLKMSPSEPVNVSKAQTMAKNAKGSIFYSKYMTKKSGLLRKRPIITGSSSEATYGIHSPSFQKKLVHPESVNDPLTSEMFGILKKSVGKMGRGPGYMNETGKWIPGKASVTKTPMDVDFTIPGKFNYFWRKRLLSVAKKKYGTSGDVHLANALGTSTDWRGNPVLRSKTTNVKATKNLFAKGKGEVISLAEQSGRKYGSLLLMEHKGRIKDIPDYLRIKALGMEALLKDPKVSVKYKNEAMVAYKGDAEKLTRLYGNPLYMPKQLAKKMYKEPSSYIFDFLNKAIPENSKLSKTISNIGMRSVERVPLVDSLGNVVRPSKYSLGKIKLQKSMLIPEEPYLPSSVSPSYNTTNSILYLGSRALAPSSVKTATSNWPSYTSKSSSSRSYASSFGSLSSGLSSSRSSRSSAYSSSYGSSSAYGSSSSNAMLGLPERRRRRVSEQERQKIEGAYSEFVNLMALPGGEFVFGKKMTKQIEAAEVDWFGL